MRVLARVLPSLFTALPHTHTSTDDACNKAETLQRTSSNLSHFLFVSFDEKPVGSTFTYSGISVIEEDLNTAHILKRDHLKTMVSQGAIIVSCKRKADVVYSEEAEEDSPSSKRQLCLPSQTNEREFPLDSPGSMFFGSLKGKLAMEQPAALIEQLRSSLRKQSGETFMPRGFEPGPWHVVSLSA